MASDLHRHRDGSWFLDARFLGDVMKNIGHVLTVAAWVLSLLCLIGFIANLEDSNVAHKCDYSGKVDLNGVIYTCAKEIKP